jgi:hypothetical protein
MEYNECSTQKDPNSSCMDSRSDAVIFRYNTVFNNVGSAIRIGGHTINGHTFGQNNEVYGNVFKDNEAGALKVQTGPHKASTFCDNKCEGTCEVGGSVAKDYKDIEGECSGNMEIYWVDDTEAAEVVSKDSKDSKDSSDGEPDGEPEVEVTVKGNDKSKSSDSKCFPVKIKDIKASCEDGKNTAHSAVDGKALTRWSAEGKDEWLELDFGASKEMNAVEISFYKGDSRKQSFDVFVEGEAVLEGQESSGKTLSMEKFPFSPTKGSSLTVMGKGNSENDWNSLTELIVCGTSESEDSSSDSGDDKASNKCDKVRKLEVKKVTATSDDGNKAENVLDGDLKTRWSANGPDQQELTLELEEKSFVLDIGIAVRNGDTRRSFFDVLALTSHGWEEVIIDGTSNKGLGIESYDVGVEEAEEIKIVFYGYKDTESDEMETWNSITEVELYGC